MKEQTLLEIKNKVDAITRIIQQLINEITHLRELGVGTLETIKLLPGYKEAIDQLKKNMEEKLQEKNKVQENEISQ